MKPSSLKSFVCTPKGIAVVISLALVTGLIVPRFFTLSITPSLKYRLFFTTRSNIVVSNGDYVMFPHANIATHGRTLPLLKRVGCDEGDVLVVDSDNRFFCNDVAIGVARTKFETAKNVPVFRWSGKVPSGYFLPIGDNPHSFDGRYFGFVRKSVIVAKEYPII